MSGIRRCPAQIRDPRTSAPRPGPDFYTVPKNMDVVRPGEPTGTSVSELAGILQKSYLAVGKVITSDEARDLANKAGAGLVGSLPTPPPSTAPHRPRRAPMPTAVADKRRRGRTRHRPLGPPGDRTARIDNRAVTRTDDGAIGFRGEAIVFDTPTWIGPER